jgi:hypothetical protein
VGEIGMETVRGMEGGRVKGEGRYLPLDIYVSLKFLNFVETVENNQEQWNAVKYCRFLLKTVDFC